jgi:hypothetical protein
MPPKKNIGKKGKARWAKATDTSGYTAQLQQAYEQTTLKSKVQKLIAKKKKEGGASALFKVQIVPDEKTTGKLAKDRFFAKPNAMPIELEREITNMAKKQQRNLSNMTVSPGNTQPGKAAVIDIWGTPAPAQVLTKSGARKAKHTKEGLTTVPAVLTPHEGQSYNPSSQSHYTLLQNVVDQDEKLEKGVQNPSKIKDFTKRVEQSLKTKPSLKADTKKQGKVWEEQKAFKAAKDLKNMEYNYFKFLKDGKQDIKEHSNFLFSQKNQNKNWMTAKRIKRTSLKC